ncbi:DUF3267 domain-containing protein [Anaerovorax odorimutans]|uniref:DUF3267 domain-containing protein n=1 Tax=Anaerovorax odorimutans TaxID=109327 RepID=A0ABT1RSR5_9FIRM|nr:DUF3267 domain-containing protein [Anaerovorax odorimutans]MCQ4638254.1 DUF3267 domain-containing protein [Anaerovorax odorimutans]
MTDKELRIENYRRQRQAMLDAGYSEHVETISVIKANIWALVTAGPFVAAAAVLYLTKWGEILISIRIGGVILFLLLFLLSIPVHEGLHGLTWGICCRNHFRSIRFGIMKESGTPYCHCMEPLGFGSYIAGGLMPFLVLGIGLFLVSLYVHSSLVLLLSMMNILCAGGDTTIALLLLRYRDAEILDHPTECGFAAFRKEKGSQDNE